MRLESQIGDMRCWVAFQNEWAGFVRLTRATTSAGDRYRLSLRLSNHPSLVRLHRDDWRRKSLTRAVRQLAFAAEAEAECDVLQGKLDAMSRLIDRCAGRISHLDHDELPEDARLEVTRRIVALENAEKRLARTTARLYKEPSNQLRARVARAPKRPRRARRSPRRAVRRALLYSGGSDDGDGSGSSDDGPPARYCPVAVLKVTVEEVTPSRLRRLRTPTGQFAFCRLTTAHGTKVEQ